MSFVWYKNEDVIPGETASTYSDYFYDDDSFACAIMRQEHHRSPSVCKFTHISVFFIILFHFISVGNMVDCIYLTGVGISFLD